MDSKKLFDKYYSRLAHEGMLKALLCGIVAGFAVDFVIALVTWLIPGLKIGFAIALGVGLVVGLVTAIIFYNKAFKPTTKKIARRIDSLGLEERLITMTELENDESYIAMRQREDAQAKLSEVNSKSIKFVVARSLIIAAVVVGVIGLSMTTVNALAAAGVLDDGIIFINPPPEDFEYVMVTYMVDDETAGWIDGDTDQVLEIGDSTTPVTAVANDGWVFLEWVEDKNNSPERFESGVVGDMVFTATFVEMLDQSNNETGPSDDPSDAEPSDEPPPESKENDDPPKENENNPQNETDKPNDGTGKFLDSNQVQDGKTPYQDYFDLDYDEAMNELANNSNISPEAKAMLEAYFEQLKAGAGANDGDADSGSTND